MEEAERHWLARKRKEKPVRRLRPRPNGPLVIVLTPRKTVIARIRFASTSLKASAAMQAVKNAPLATTTTCEIKL